jgi:hypothetical protein
LSDRRTVLATTTFSLVAALGILVWYAVAYPATQSERPLDPRRLVANALAAIRDTLPDGESARFRYAHVGKLDGRHVVCGEMTTRGPGGGYGDFVRFVQGEKIARIEPVPGTSELRDLWRDAGCSLDAARARR